MTIRWYYGIAVNFLRCGNGLWLSKRMFLGDRYLLEYLGIFGSKEL